MSRREAWASLFWITFFCSGSFRFISTPKPVVKPPSPFFNYWISLPPVGYWIPPNPPKTPWIVLFCMQMDLMFHIFFFAHVSKVIWPPSSFDLFFGLLGPFVALLGLRLDFFSDSFERLFPGFIFATRFFFCLSFTFFAFSWDFFSRKAIDEFFFIEFFSRKNIDRTFFFRFFLPAKSVEKIYWNDFYNFFQLIRYFFKSSQTICLHFC